MANEIQNLELPDYSIEYTPTKIEIKNYDHLADVVKTYANRYKNVVVTSDTEKDAKAILAKLRKLSTALDDKRKGIKNGYQEPLKAFETQIKALTDTVAESTYPIDQALKELTNQQKKEKETWVREQIAEMAPNYEVGAESVEIDPKWLLKSTSKKSILEAIAEGMKLIKKHEDDVAAQALLLTKYAESKGVDPAGWVDQLKQGQDADYLMKAVDNQVRVEAERKKQEAAKLAAETAHQEQKGETIVDTDTGEVVSHTVALKITATIAQMTGLKRYMDDYGIRYERVK